MEDFAYILDYMAQGIPDDRRFKREPLVYALGESEFKLFELVPKPGATMQMADRVYIGKDLAKREHIMHVKRRVGFDDLTNAARNELMFVTLKIIENNADRFLRFYNEAQAITTRFHMLELLPGLGKKTMWAILEERKKGPFKSFREMEERTSALHNPEKLIAKRVELELSEPDQKYHLFVAK